MEPFYESRPDYEKLVDRLVGVDKLRIREVLSSYSHEEIALAYCYWSMYQEDVGYTRVKTKK